MSLILRLQKGSALTNEELDNNFIFLNEELNTIRDDATELTEDTIPFIVATINEQLDTKQGLNARLSSITALSTAGLMSVDGSAVVARSISAGSNNITITDGDGVAGNPTIDIASTVLTTTGNQTVTNKQISGSQNTLTNIPLATAVTGILPVENGGTGSSTSAGSRLNLGALIDPAGTGIVVKTGSDASVGRQIAVSGVGLSVTNASGALGNPTIVSNATSANVVDTIVSRDSAGNFSAGTITATLNGTAAQALQVSNGVYTTGSYNDPTWITGLAGSKVTAIPNASLTNNTITINGESVPLGGSFTFELGMSANTPNTGVRRDGSGNFSAGTITANLVGNVSGNSTTSTRLQNAVLINGVSFNGSTNITVADNTKLPLTGGTVSGSVNIQGITTSRFVQTIYNNGSITTSLAADWSRGSVHVATLTSNFSLLEPTNMPNGASLTILLKQDANGSRLMTPASEYLFFSGNKTLSIAPNSVDKLEILKVDGKYYTTLTTEFKQETVADTYIVVIDESSVSATTLAANWTRFRNANPTVRFYLLAPGGDIGALQAPASYTSDAIAFGPFGVARDNGNAAAASDWFSICNLASASSRSRIRIAIDNSGSMTTSTVQASYSLFLQKTKQANLQVEFTRMTNEDWASVF